MFFDYHLFNFMIRRINILKLGRVKEKKKEAGKEGEKGKVAEHSSRYMVRTREHASHGRT